MLCPSCCPPRRDEGAQCWGQVSCYCIIPACRDEVLVGGPCCTCSLFSMQHLHMEGRTSFLSYVCCTETWLFCSACR